MKNNLERDLAQRKNRLYILLKNAHRQATVSYAISCIALGIAVLVSIITILIKIFL